MTQDGAALITGAASGIGRALAIALAAEGRRIAAIDRNADALGRLEQELLGQGRSIACERGDVTDAVGFQEKVRRLEHRMGPTELLIASAGVGIETSATSMNPQEIATVIEVNLVGVANSIAAVLPGMMERRRGHVVGLSSVASFLGVPRMLAYCASKSGLNAFLEGLRVELRPYNIAVTTICPGWVRTPMTAGLDPAIPGMLEADEAARVILHAIRRRRRFHAFPRSLAWRLKLMRWLPDPWRDWLLARAADRIGKK
jgi:short-subunit dehydrogenase